jgi:hypothetical protein
MIIIRATGNQRTAILIPSESVKKHEMHYAIVWRNPMLQVKHRFICLLGFLTSEQRQAVAITNRFHPAMVLVQGHLIPIELPGLLRSGEQSIKDSLSQALVIDS